MVQERCAQQGTYTITTVFALAPAVIWTIQCSCSYIFTYFLPQMELAFAPGYDPALELAQHSLKQANADVDGELLDVLDELTFDNQSTGPLAPTGHLRRREQDWIDRIVHGAKTGHYYVLLGPKVSWRWLQLAHLLMKGWCNSDAL